MTPMASTRFVQLSGVLLLILLASPTCTAKTHVANLATVGSFSNATTFAFLQMARFSAWYFNQQTDILPDVEINLDIRNCGSGAGNPPSCLVHSINALQTGSYTGFLTAAYTSDQRIIQYAASAWGLPQVSGAASGTILSNKVEYPTYFRTSPSDELQDILILDMMVRMGWTHVAVALADGDWGSGNYDVLTAYGTELGIKMESFICPSGGVSFEEQAQRIKSRGYNVIIPMLNAREIFVFLDGANKTGIIGPDYVWLSPLTVVHNVLTPGYMASLQRTVPFIDVFGLRKLLDGSIGFMVSGGSPNFDLYNKVLPLWTANADEFMAVRPVSPYVWLMFDAVMTYVWALDTMIKGGTAFEDIRPAALINTIKKADFNGTTGRVSFNENGDRIALLSIYTFTADTLEVAQIYDPFQKTYTEFLPLVFYGGRRDTPPDRLNMCQGCVNGRCENQICICNAGYTGSDCSVEMSEQDNTVAIGVSVSVGGALVIGFIIFIIFYRHKHSVLVKDIAGRQQSDIPRAEIKLQTIIGHGAVGEVFSGLFRGTDVAVKRIRSNGVLSQAAIQEFKLESAIMCSLRHPNIVLFMGSCYDTTSQEMLLVMEYMKKGTLHGVLANKQITMPFSLQLHLAYQTAQGINFLHQCTPPVIHCDIKSHNVLLDDKWCARISDFGITRFSQLSKKAKKLSGTLGTSTDGATPESDKHGLGTIFWAAPEVLSGTPHSLKSDCYAFGVVLWEIFHRVTPYGNADPLHIALQVANKGLRPPISDTVPPKIATLIEKCWAQDPTERPSLEEVTISLREIMLEGETTELSLTDAGAHTGTVFFAATRVQYAGELWNLYPEDMARAMLLHNSVLRAEIQKYKGYELMYKDEEFLVAFAKLSDAINWSNAIHTQLLHTSWPKFGDNTITKFQRDNEGNIVWDGLRVSIAIHKGKPTVKRDPRSDKIIYEGTCKDVPAQVLDVVPGGLTVVTEPVYDMIKASDLAVFQDELDMSEHVRFYSKEAQRKETTYVVIAQVLKSRKAAATSKPPSLSHIPNAIIVDIDELADNADVDLAAANAIALKDISKQKWNIPFTDIQTKEKIGKSVINEVFRGTWNSNEVAVKLFFNPKLGEELVFELKSAVAIASKFDHPNVVKYHGLTTKESQLGLVQEYVPQSLQKYVSGHKPTGAEISKFSLQIACGMRYLHQTNNPKFSIHKALKSCNIMLTKNGEAKVSDYAISGFSDVLRTLTSVDTVAWTAPEVLQGMNVTDASTVYSYGVLLWEIIYQKTPFDGVHPIKLVAQIIDGARPPVGDDCPVKVKDVMLKCWAGEPTNRPTWSEIITLLS